MKIEHETPFPTVGEVILAAFRWSGLWNFAVDVDKECAEAQKQLKTLQKRLQRLSNEQGLMSFEEIGKLVALTLSNALPEFNIAAIALRSVELLLRSYTLEVLSNATWLGRQETARWFLSTRSVPPLVLTAQRLALLAQEAGGRHALIVPDEDFWFLPSKGEQGEWVMPVQKVLKWWMQINGFKSAEQLEKRVGKQGQISAVTIRSWINGDVVPEISTLRILASSNLDLGPNEQNHKNSLQCLMIVSRLVHGFFSVVRQSLGEDGACQFLADFHTLYRAYDAHERHEFERKLPQVLAKLGLTFETAPAEVLLDGERFFREYVILPRATKMMNEVVKRGSADFVTGGDFVSEQARYFLRHIWVDMPQHVIEAIWSAGECERSTRLGDCLMASEDIADKLIEFRKKLQPGVNLKFSLLTVEARMAVCGGDCERAFALYVRAFQEARYRGGALINKICQELTALACFRHSQVVEHKSPRGEYWTVAKYLRDWCSMVGACGDLYDPDDEIYIEKGRRFFMKLIGTPEVG